MSLQQLFLFLRARFQVIAATLALGIVVALGFSLLMPKLYTATATVVVDVKTTDPVTGVLLPAPIMSTQLEILRSQRVALQVIDDAKLIESPTAQEIFADEADGKGSIRHWWADRLLRNAEIESRRDSNLVDINFTATDPNFAAQIANSFARAYMDTTLELTLAPARQTALFFDEELKGLRNKLEKAQKKLSEYQQENKIVATDEKLDVENERLQGLYGQYTELEGDTRDSIMRERKAMEFSARGEAPENIPDALANPLVQSLKGELLRAEAKLQEMSARIGVNHPQYQSQISEIAGLRQKLDQEIKAGARSMSTLSTINRQRASGLQKTITEQKSKMLDLRQQHDEIAVLLGEVEGAQKAYDGALQRYSQTTLTSRTSQTNVMLLNSAIGPSEPSSPHMFRNLLAGSIIGLVLGLNFAIVLELLDRRVRSKEDIVSESALPILGVLRKRREGDWRSSVLAQARKLLNRRKPSLPGTAA